MDVPILSLFLRPILKNYWWYQWCPRTNIFSTFFSTPSLRGRSVQSIRLRHFTKRLVVKRSFSTWVARLRHSSLCPLGLGAQGHVGRGGQHQEVPETRRNDLLSRLRQIRSGSAEVQKWKMFTGRNDNDKEHWQFWMLLMTNIQMVRYANSRPQTGPFFGLPVLYFDNCPNAGPFLYWIYPALRWSLSEIYVTGGRFDRTGPLACLSPFPV